MLLDQHDFLVIGVLGAQGVGKSTVMSALAGGDRKKYVVVLRQSTRKHNQVPYAFSLQVTGKLLASGNFSWQAVGLIMKSMGLQTAF